MKANTWVAQATKKLQKENISSARLDTLILLEDGSKKDRSWILAHPEFEINKELIHKLDAQIERRVGHEPLAYIRGKSEFYGREFKVSPATLQPRPETENIITLMKTLALPDKPNIADIGTGSGAIAITASLELSQANVFATEIQSDALEIARYNAELLGAGVTFHEGNLLEPLQNTAIDVILANLPYVPDSHTINQAAMQEPTIAIFGGEDGLELYRTMFSQINSLPKKPRFILTESLPFQHKSLAIIASEHGYTSTNSDDFVQVFEIYS